MLGLLNELTSRSTSTDTREQAANTEICAVFMTTAKPKIALTNQAPAYIVRLEGFSGLQSHMYYCMFLV